MYATGPDSIPLKWSDNPIEYFGKIFCKYLIFSNPKLLERHGYSETQ